MLEFLWHKVWFSLVKALPTVILRMWIKPGHVAQDLEIDLRSVSPIQVYVNAEVPWFNVWFRFTNKSAVPILIDRIVIQVWVNGPIIDGAFLHPFELAPKETRENILFEARLSSLQRDAITKRVNRAAGDQIEPNVTIHADVYGGSKVGAFHTRVTKQLYDIRVEGLAPVSVTL